MSEFHDYVVNFVRDQIADNDLLLEELAARVRAKFPRYTLTVQDIVDANGASI